MKWNMACEAGWNPKPSKDAEPVIPPVWNETGSNDGNEIDSRSELNVLGKLSSIFRGIIYRNVG